ncbi:MAG: MATE family efflux transporter [Cellulosilyticaceae bacterium]
MNIDRILNGNIIKVWLKFVMASVVGVVFNAIYTLVDGIFVGQGVGELGLASINIAWPAITVILAIGLLLGTGASSLISISIGKKDVEEAERILGTMVKAGLIIGVILTILGLTCSDFLITLLGAKEDTFQYTKDYYTVIYCMAIPYIFSTALNPVVRADGKPWLSMAMIGIGAISNVILDFLFVIVLGGGTFGAALATGASIFISTACSFYYFIKGNSHISLRKKYFKINKEILSAIIKTGFVLFAVELSVGIILLLQNNIIYHYGNTTDVAIYSAAGYIISLYIQLCLGISQGMQPLIGYHYGANKQKRMKAILGITVCVCFSIGVLSYLALFFFGNQIIGVFGLSGKVLEIAYQRILIFCMGIPVTGIIYTVGAYYQATKRNIEANIISISRGCILQVFFSLALPPFLGVEGVFWTQSLSDIGSILILFGVILFGQANKNKGKDKMRLVDECDK